MAQPSVMQEPGYLLKRAQSKLRARMDDALRPIGLTTSQYAVLAILEEDVALSNAELARRSFITPQTMNKILETLESRGLVERRPHASHGRILETRLTSIGASIVRRCHKAVHAIEDQMLSRLEVAERERFADYLARCIDGLDRPDAER